MSIRVRSVLLRRTEMTRWTHAPRPHRCPSSQPFLLLSNQQCVTTQRRPGGVTSTSSSVIQMAPVQSTRFKCFLHSFRYHCQLYSVQSNCSKYTKLLLYRQRVTI